MRLRAAVLGVALAAPLFAADLEHPYERAGWARTGSERGGKPTWGQEPAPVPAPVPVPVPVPGPGPAPVPGPAAGPAPAPYEHSDGFSPRRAPRPAWTSGETPPD